jgi:hypothetical protein
VSDSKLRLPKPKLTNHPVDVGQRTEAAILSELVRRGYSVLLPFGVNQRYDLVLELGERLLRVQCKTGRRRGGSIEFSTVAFSATQRDGSRGTTRAKPILSSSIGLRTIESMLSPWRRLPEVICT